MTGWKELYAVKMDDGSHLQAVLSGESTGGSVAAVEPVLQVNTSLSYQVVSSHHVIVIDEH